MLDSAFNGVLSDRFAKGGKRLRGGPWYLQIGW